MAKKSDKFKKYAENFLRKYYNKDENNFRAKKGIVQRWINNQA